jgi:membrane associated rhomboid family serine protease
MIGASGAVSGISIAYILLYPRCRIYSALVILRFIWIFRIPASVLVGAHLLIDIGSVSFHLEDGVAYWAHLGGAVTGAV